MATRKSAKAGYPQQVYVVDGDIRAFASDGTASPTGATQEDILIALTNPALFDAFGRSRVSTPDSVFNSKQLFDNQALFWDDKEVSGAGTTSTYSTNNASTLIGVSNATAGKRVRQTFQRPDYQTGKSQEVLMTFANIATTTGNVKQAGLFDENNGIFLRNEDEVASFVVRSFTSGAAVDNVIPQSSWNTDKFDTATYPDENPSGITLDFSKVQILYMDFEWLGVGAVVFGFVIGRKVYIAHIEDHVNSETTVYMSTPNLPLRYTIENKGTGAADTFRHICSTVISEGGQQETGSTTAIYTAPTHINMNTIDTIYAGVGVRLKSTHVGTATAMTSISIIAETNDDFGWLLLFNPTINYTAGGEAPINWQNKTNSGTQFAIASGGTVPTANTITAGSEGFVMASGVGKSGTAVSTVVNNTLKLGSGISENVAPANIQYDEIWLCVTTLSSNGDFQLVLNYQER